MNSKGKISKKQEKSKKLKASMPIMERDGWTLWPIEVLYDMKEKEKA